MARIIGGKPFDTPNKLIVKYNNNNEEHVIHRTLVGRLIYLITTHSISPM